MSGNIEWFDALEQVKKGAGQIVDTGRVFVLVDGDSRKVCFWESRYAAVAQTKLAAAAKRARKEESKE